MLTDRLRERVRREDRRAGEVIAILYNINRNERTEAIDWWDVFPEWKQETEQTDEDMYQTMMMWTKVKPLPS